MVGGIRQWRPVPRLKFGLVTADETPERTIRAGTLTVALQLLLAAEATRYGILSAAFQRDSLVTRLGIRRWGHEGLPEPSYEVRDSHQFCGTFESEKAVPGPRGVRRRGDPAIAGCSGTTGQAGESAEDQNKVRVRCSWGNGGRSTTSTSNLGQTETCPSHAGTKSLGSSRGSSASHNPPLLHCRGSLAAATTSLHHGFHGKQQQQQCLPSVTDSAERQTTCRSRVRIVPQAQGKMQFGSHGSAM